MDTLDSAVQRWLRYHQPDEVFSQPGPTQLHDTDRPLVVVDWDGTLHPYMQAVMLHEDVPSVDLDALEHYYHFHEIIGHDLLYRVGSDETALKRMIEAGLYANALDQLRELARIANIVVMSHRTLDHGQLLSDAIKAFAAPHVCLLVGAVDKIRFCVDHDAALLIDDKPSTLQSAHEAGVATASLIHSYNAQTIEELGVIAAHGWDELGPKVIAHVKSIDN